MITPLKDLKVKTLIQMKYEVKRKLALLRPDSEMSQKHKVTVQTRRHKNKALNGQFRKKAIEGGKVIMVYTCIKHDNLVFKGYSKAEEFVY